MRPQTVFVSATPGPWELGAHRRRVHRAGDPPDRTDRSAGRSASGRVPGRRSAGGVQARRQGRLSRAGDHADQAHGRGPHRVSARERRARALHALRRRDAGAYRDRARSAARRVRRARRHQSAARRPGHSGMCARRDPRRRQGRLPAVGDLIGPDHRSRGAQCRGQGHSVRGSYDGIDETRDGGDRASPREAAGLQSRARHHARRASRRTSPISWPPPTSATTCWWTPALPRTLCRSGTICAPISRSWRSGCGRSAGDLEFEEAARIRDEIKRLQATELAIADDPFARQSAVEDAVDTAMRSPSPANPAAARSTKGAPGTRAIRGKKPQPRRAH